MSGLADTRVWKKMFNYISKIRIKKIKNTKNS